MLSVSGRSHVLSPFTFTHVQAVLRVCVCVRTHVWGGRGIGGGMSVWTVKEMQALSAPVCLSEQLGKRILFGLLGSFQSLFVGMHRIYPPP